MDQPYPLTNLSAQYSDFVFLQRERLKGEYLESLIKNLKKQLIGAVPVLEEPEEKIRKYSSDHYKFSISPLLYKSLKNFSRSQRCTLFMTLIAVFKLILHQYTKKEDIIVNTPFSNRGKKEFQDIIGYFTNDQIIRTSFIGNPTFTELLTQVKKRFLEAYSIQELPRGLVSLGPDCDKIYSQMRSQIIFSLHYEEPPPLSILGLTSSYIKIDLTLNYVGLYLIMEVRQGNLFGTFFYSNDYFSSDTISKMAEAFTVSLEEIVVGIT
jgi:non-ribosomal peptide synthetase component F